MQIPSFGGWHNNIYSYKQPFFYRAQLVNIDANFVQADGTISHHDMHDYLHLTQKGYDKAFEPVNDLLIQLLTESETDHVRTEAEGAAE